MKKALVLILIILLFAGCGVLGYFTYSLKEDNTKYQKDIKDYKAEIQKYKDDQKSDNVKIDCSKSIVGSKYVVPDSGNDGSNGEPVTENTAMSFSESKVRQNSGTAAWEDNYLINDSVITFENSGAKAYGIISQDCKTMYIFDAQSTSGVNIYQRVS